MAADDAGLQLRYAVTVGSGDGAMALSRTGRLSVVNNGVGGSTVTTYSPIGLLHYRWNSPYWVDEVVALRDDSLAVLATDGAGWSHLVKLSPDGALQYDRDPARRLSALTLTYDNQLAVLSGDRYAEASSVDFFSAESGLRTHTVTGRGRFLLDNGQAGVVAVWPFAPLMENRWISLGGELMATTQIPLSYYRSVLSAPSANGLVGALAYPLCSSPEGTRPEAFGLSPTGTSWTRDFPAGPGGCSAFSAVMLHGGRMIVDFDPTTGDRGVTAIGVTGSVDWSVPYSSTVGALGASMSLAKVGNRVLVPRVELSACPGGALPANTCKRGSFDVIDSGGSVITHDDLAAPVLDSMSRVVESVSAGILAGENGFSVLEERRAAGTTDVIGRRYLVYQLNPDAPLPPAPGEGGGCAELRGDTNGDCVVRVAIVGDSYISGEGAAEEIDGFGGNAYEFGTDEYTFGLNWKGISVWRPRNLCHRSRSSWAYRFAREELGARDDQILFAACSGAETKHLVESAQYNEGLQIDRLEAYQNAGPIDLVLLSIGGNDAGFSGIVKTCLLVTSCQNLGWAQSKVASAEDLASRLEMTAIKVAAAARTAQVWWVGYPDPTGGSICPSVAPGGPFPPNSLLHQLVLDAGELSWLSGEFLPALNQSIASAAAAANVEQVDVTHAFDGHRLCSPTAWVNGFTVGNDLPVANGGPLGNESFHPNAAGHNALLQLLLDRTRADGSFAEAASYVPSTIRVAPPSNTTSCQWLSTGAGTAIQPAATISLQGQCAAPGRELRVVLSSVPTVIGSISSDSRGEVAADVTLPDWLPPGRHTLALQDVVTGEILSADLIAAGVSPGCEIGDGDGDVDADLLPDRCDRNPLDGPAADADSDGVPNREDNCPNVPNVAQSDSNSDGLGDVCDPVNGHDPFEGARPAADLTSATALVPLVPARLLETRGGPGLGTVDGEASGAGPLAAGSVLELRVAGRAGVPLDASAVVLNVAVVDARGPGFVTVFPCGSERPNAANLNYLAGDTVPNAVVAKVGSGGRVCVFTYAAVDLAIDINGYF